MIAGFTGTRIGMNVNQKMTFLKKLKLHNITELHHGDCVSADAQAHDLAEGLGIKIVTHPPSDDRLRAFKWSNEAYPPKPYIERNHDIVNACDILFVAPKSNEEELRSGTWATFRYAAKKGKDVIILSRV